MKKSWIKIFAVFLIFLVLLHAVSLWYFSRFKPRIEIYFKDSVPSQAMELLQSYHVEKQDENLLIIKSNELNVFVNNEIEDILNSHEIRGFEINDRSQALRLAQQSAEIVILIAEISITTLLLSWICKELKVMWRQFQLELQEKYLKDVIINHVETILIHCIQFTIEGFVLVFLVMKILDFSLYIPFSWIPPEYIFDFSYFFNINYQKIGNSSYEQFCQRMLPFLYMLSLVEGLIGIYLRRWVGRTIVKEKSKK